MIAGWVLAAVLGATPGPSPTPHYLECLADPFVDDLGFIACAPLPAMKHFCTDHHAGAFVDFIYGKIVVVSCKDADFQWDAVKGWIRMDDLTGGDRSKG